MPQRIIENPVINSPYFEISKHFQFTDEEISNEFVWEGLYRTKSQPFPVPENGKIAVKVINHYGDEVLKVYGV